MMQPSFRQLHDLLNLIERMINHAMKNQYMSCGLYAGFSQIAKLFDAYIHLQNLFGFNPTFSALFKTTFGLSWWTLINRCGLQGIEWKTM